MTGHTTAAGTLDLNITTLHETKVDNCLTTLRMYMVKMVKEGLVKEYCITRHRRPIYTTLGLK